MDYQTIIVDRKGHVGVITLNRPEVRNALNAQLMEEISLAVNEVQKSLEEIQKRLEEPG